MTIKIKVVKLKKCCIFFYDIYTKTIEMGMRPNTYFDKAGWKFMIFSLKKQINHAFTKAQLKNKWMV